MHMHHPFCTCTAFNRSFPFRLVHSNSFLPALPALSSLSSMSPSLPGLRMLSGRAANEHQGGQQEGGRQGNTTIANGW
ncbi:hypothetical protein CLOP_g24689 [Closterium sp. NIES-67]|nr:hypothetical protein CLOP_g24689 [Closterium sp. NIES-67]